MTKRYRIWCEVWGGVTGERSGWLRVDDDDSIFETTDRQEAEDMRIEMSAQQGLGPCPATFRYSIRSKSI